MSTETHVFLAVFYCDDPPVVSAIMGLEPTEAWVKGEHYRDDFPKARRTHSRWKVSSGLPKTEPVERHLEALLAKIESKGAEIKSVAARFPIGIWVAQYFYETNPGFRLEPDMLRRIAALGVPLDFDQYCLGADEGEEDESKRGGTPDQSYA